MLKLNNDDKEQFINLIIIGAIAGVVGGIITVIFN